MAPFNYFGVMAWSLFTLAACAVVTVLKSFGFWRWLQGKALDWTGRV
jgi:hypothetical protein